MKHLSAIYQSLQRQKMSFSFFNRYPNLIKFLFICLALLIIAIIIFSSSGENISKNYSVESEKNEVLSVEMVVHDSDIFVNGYTVVEASEIQEESTHYYLIIDTSGNVISVLNKDDTEYCGRYDYYFYFVKNNSIICINHNGDVIFINDYSPVEDNVTDFSIQMNYDGTFFLERIYSTVETKKYQVALVDYDGTMISDYVTIKSGAYVEDYRDISYCCNGYALWTYYNSYFPSNTYSVLIDFNLNSIIKLEKKMSRGHSIFYEEGDEYFILREHNGEIRNRKYYQSWRVYFDGTQQIIKDDVLFTQYPYIGDYAFKTVFNNANDCYITLIDKSGNYLFEPIWNKNNEVPENYYNDMFAISTSDTIVKFYDIHGDLVESIDLVQYGVDSIDYIYSKYAEGFYAFKNESTGFWNYLSSDGSLLLDDWVLSVPKSIIAKENNMDFFTSNKQ